MSFARATAVASVAMTLASPAHAQSTDEMSPSLAVDLVGPAECITVDELERKILAFAGREAGAAVHLTALVEIRPTDDGGWHARVETLSRSHAGDREFVGATCDEVATAAAALLALAVDVAPVDTTAKTSPPAPPDEPVVIAARAPEPRADRPPRFRAHADLGADVGVLPGVAPAAGVGAGVRLGRFRIDLDARLWDEARAVVGAELDAGATVRLWAVGGRVCVPWRAVGACAGGEWGVMSGQSYGIEMPRSEAGQWLSATVAAVGAWPVWGRVELLAELGVAVPILSPRFYVQGELVHVPSPVAGRARFGVQMRFP